VTSEPAPTLASAGRRRLIGVAVLRSLATATVLAGLYYLLPLDHLASVPLVVTLVAGLLVLPAAAWQLRLRSQTGLTGSGSHMVTRPGRITT
jgi:hypothetical protein